MNKPFYERLVAYLNRKQWWHVPPQDSKAYSKRGKFLASTYAEAEFWGRPLDEPLRVNVSHPLVGDEATIERTLLGRLVSTEDISVKERWALDAKMKTAELKMGYDSIVLMAPKAFAKFKASGKIPRSIELNLLETRLLGALRRSPFY